MDQFTLVLDIDDTLVYPSPFQAALALVGDNARLMDVIKRSEGFQQKLLAAPVAPWLDGALGHKLITGAGHVILVTGRPKYLNDVTQEWWARYMARRYTRGPVGIEIINTPYITWGQYVEDRTAFIKQLGKDHIYIDDNAVLFGEAAARGIRALYIHEGHVRDIAGWP